jgi:type VI secretion system protein ImpA
MRHEKLFEPVDSVEPCGPDLDELGDDDYLNYVLPAEDRLPVRFTEGQFYGGASMEPFDRTAIDLKSEIGNISALLARSRDLRLLALEARFQVVAGQFAGFAEAIQAMAGLVAQYWDTVHPVGQDGDFTLRQNTLASLDDRVKVILPLHFASIVRDKKLGPLSYRHYAVASGAVQPRAEETPLQPEAIIAALGSDDNRQSVAAVHAALTSAAEGLKVIRASFVKEVGFEFAPGFDGLAGSLAEIAGLIQKAVPGLGRAPPGADADVPGSGEGGGETGIAADTGPSGEVQDRPAVQIDSQKDAAAALGAAETYFATCEPSAPALILVRQARLLIGKPLVAALEALAPQAAELAIIRFDGPLRFQMDIGRMRQLTGEASSADEPAAPEATSRFAIESRADAAALIAGVESYFRRAEPSSPAPMLLAKARSFMNQDFLSILKDLTAAEGQNPGG